MRKPRITVYNLNDISLKRNIQTKYNLDKITPEMKTRKISQMLTIILSLLISLSKTFTFSNSLENVQSSKTDTFSVVLSLQTHLLALADWLLDFLKPQLARKSYQVLSLHFFVICFLYSLITIFQIHLMGII